MTRFRHDLILRMIKLLDAVLVTIPFAMCWYLYYAKRCIAVLCKGRLPGRGTVLCAVHHLWTRI